MGGPFPALNSNGCLNSGYAGAASIANLQQPGISGRSAAFVNEKFSKMAIICHASA
jgi:hypothetical protein